MPSAKPVVRNRTNARRKKYGDRPLPPGKQRKNMLCDERGPDAVDRKDLGHHRGVELPKALFRADVRSAVQEPRRHDHKVEGAIPGDLTTCLGKRGVVQYIDRQPCHVGMMARMGPPVPGIDAVKSTRCDQPIDKRGADTAAAPDHQCALAAQMPFLPATGRTQVTETLRAGGRISHVSQREGRAVA